MSSEPGGDIVQIAPGGPAPQRLAQGRYVVRRALGEGGQKVVYLVDDTALDRECALGLLKTESLDADGLMRIRREAQAMARLGANPRIVTVFDVGEDEGRPYIVSEYIAGGDLRDELRRADGPLSIERALDIGIELAAALAVAHDQQIIHRDLKPANVWFTADGHLKLGDFGLAVGLDRSRMTLAGGVFGTATYMPPEQALGGDVTPRSDLYALGVMLYEMLTGRPPFLGEDPLAVISQHVNTSAVAPAWQNALVPPALDALVMRLLAKEPGDRPATAATLQDELRRIRETLALGTATLEPPAPTDLRGIAWGQFVGRHDEMDQLRAAYEAAVSQGAVLMLIAGEPGIGKSRLVQEFGVYARLRGAQMLVGRCYEGESAVPYGPVIEAFRQYVRSRPDAELRKELGSGAAAIAAVVSEVRERLGDLPDRAEPAPEVERLRLFESVANFLRNAASATPVVLAIDDLQWADASSLLLLRFLARELSTAGTLLVGTYRDIELDRTHPLAETLTALRREPNVRRVSVRGLTRADVAGLLQAIEPAEAAASGRDALAEALFATTEGNPFFIREVLSHLVEEGLLRRVGGVWTAGATSIAELGIPEGVREVMGRRLSRLSEECRRMLIVASTMTGGFSWQALQAASGEEESRLLDLLDEALGAQLLYERKEEQTGWYDFTHTLVRQTLYESLSTPRRVLLHQRVGDALEALYGDHADAHIGELAYHFYRTAQGGRGTGKAITYAGRAGERAAAHLAYEEAATHCERALELMELEDAPDTARRCDVLLALADHTWRAGQHERARAIYREAAEIAWSLGSGQRLAHAAIRVEGEGAISNVGVFDADLVLLLERALELQDDEDGPQKARVMAALAGALAFTEQRERAEALRSGAVELARRCGDPAALAYVLFTTHWTSRTPADATGALALATEAAALADSASDRSLMGRAWKGSVLLETGRVADAEIEASTYHDMAWKHRIPYQLHWAAVWDGMRAGLAGRIEEAERLAQEAFVAGQHAGAGNALAIFGVQLFLIRWAQGRSGELEPSLRDLAGQYPLIPAWRTALAFILSESGRHEEAAVLFDELAAGEFASIPPDMFWLTCMVLLAEVCGTLGDRPRAAALYLLLVPYASHNVMVGLSAACLGPVSRCLGILAATDGRWEDAHAHFETALATCEQLQTPLWRGQTQCDYARMLLARGADGDRGRAHALLDDCRAAAGSLGLDALASRAAALSEGTSPASEAAR